MNTNKLHERIFLPGLALASLAPAIASAQTLSSVLGLFNVAAGLMLVVGILTFFGGFIGYLVLLGTEKRKDGLYVMVWGIAVLFVLAILMGAIDMLQGALSFVLGFGLVILCVIVIIQSLAKSGGAPKEDHAG